MEIATCQTLSDLRRQPLKAQAPLIEDLLQESQLLPGEQVRVIETAGEWARVEAIEQPRYGPRWQGYNGWVGLKNLQDATPIYNAYLASHNQDFPFGSRLIAEKPQGELIQTDRGLFPKHCIRFESDPIADPRSQFLDYASSFIGMPYQWGGRSSYLPDRYPISSVDCSGLVNLALWVMGYRVPRDAHDQWMQAKPINPEQLKRGDLIFTAKTSNPGRITHVMILKDQDTLIEAASDAGKVREVSVKEKLGLPIEAIKNGLQYETRLIWAGSFF